MFKFRSSHMTIWPKVIIWCNSWAFRFSSYFFHLQEFLPQQKNAYSLVWLLVSSRFFPQFCILKEGNGNNLFFIAAVTSEYRITTISRWPWPTSVFGSIISTFIIVWPRHSFPFQRKFHKLKCSQLLGNSCISNLTLIYYVMEPRFRNAC